MPNIYKILCVILLILFIPWILSASAVAGEQQVILNETWVPNTAAATNLVQSNLAGVIYDPDPVVKTNGTTTPKMLTVEGIDYKYYNTNGTIQAIAGGQLDGLTDASIDYAYVAPSKAAQQQLIMLAGVIKSLGAILPLLLIVVGLIGSLVILGRS
tara:strand:+ start:6545 stop:7012 length:468 start_codon:yes stop_codon:yes gene_type:complete